MAGPAVEARQARDPFDRGRVGVEFGLAAMTECWNLNERRESLVEGTAALWGAIRDGLSLGVAFNHLRVFQRTPDAFVQGFSPLLRWRFVERDTWSAFVEVGPGISWSDLPTPPRGTKINYLFQGGGGVMRRVGSNSHAVVGARFLHLSNNHREGLNHNPDLDMIGPFAGFSFSF
jgi:hypothetical protein